MLVKKNTLRHCISVVTHNVARSIYYGDDSMQCLIIAPVYIWCHIIYKHLIVRVDICMYYVHDKLFIHVSSEQSISL